MPTGPIVPDSSAWIEYLRDTGSSVTFRMDELIRADAELVVTGPVLMEVLAGGGDESQRRAQRNLLARYCYAAASDPSDYEDAARLYRRMRSSGRTLRSQIDCLIAVVAMRIDAAVLHKDADFDAIAEVAPLRIA